WNLKLPNKAELDTFKKDIAKNMEIPAAIYDHLRSYDLSTVHPMAALRTAISLLGLYDEDADVMEESANKEKAMRMQAKISSIVTAFARIRQGKDPVKPKKELGFAENFLYMLKGEEANEIEVEAINKAL